MKTQNKKYIEILLFVILFSINICLITATETLTCEGKGYYNVAKEYCPTNEISTITATPGFVCCKILDIGGVYMGMKANTIFGRNIVYTNTGGINHIVFNGKAEGEVSLTIDWAKDGKEIHEFKNLAKNEGSFIDLDKYGDIAKVDFLTNENAGIYDIGKLSPIKRRYYKGVEVPQNSRLVFDGKEIRIESGDGQKLTQLPNIVDEIKEKDWAGYTFKIKGDNTILPDNLGVLKSGTLTYINGKPMVLQGESIILDDKEITSRKGNVAIYKNPPNYCSSLSKSEYYYCEEDSKLQVNTLLGNDIKVKVPQPNKYFTKNNFEITSKDGDNFKIYKMDETRPPYITRSWSPKGISSLSIGNSIDNKMRTFILNNRGISTLADMYSASLDKSMAIFPSMNMESFASPGDPSKDKIDVGIVSIHNRKTSCLYDETTGTSNCTYETLNKDTGETLDYIADAWKGSAEDAEICSLTEETVENEEQSITASATKETKSCNRRVGVSNYGTTCRDSDGGKKQFIFGTTNDNTGTKKQDNCITDFQLEEFFCESGSVSFNDAIICSSGCITAGGLGKCKLEQVQQTETRAKYFSQFPDNLKNWVDMHHSLTNEEKERFVNLYYYYKDQNSKDPANDAILDIFKERPQEQTYRLPYIKIDTRTLAPRITEQLEKIYQKK